MKTVRYLLAFCYVLMGAACGKYYNEIEIGRVSGATKGETKFKVVVPMSRAGWELGVTVKGSHDETTSLDIRITNEGSRDLVVQDPAGNRDSYTIATGETRSVFEGSLRALKEATISRTNPMLFSNAPTSLSFVVISTPQSQGELRFYLSSTDAL